MILELSSNFETNKSASSVKPSCFNDFSCIYNENILSGDLHKIGIPVVYAYDEELDTALITLHEKKEDLLESS